MRADEKIVITGIGLITPLGLTREMSWKNLISGNSGLDYIDGLPVAAAGQVKDYDISDNVPRAVAFACTAADEAVRDACIDLDIIDTRRFGCTVSVTKPSMDSNIIYANQELANDAVRKKFGLRGPGGNYTAACATGVVSLHAGLLYIKSNMADYCLVGSSESSLNSFYTAGFKRMGVYAQVKDDPATAIRPFSVDRSGFLPAEGAGIFVIERVSSAMRRGAYVYGTVDSCVIGNDGYNPVIFNSNGRNIARVLSDAVIRAGWAYDQVDYINAHGTGTKLNDYLEASALHDIFGNSHSSLSISSTKGSTGHLLGAAGSVEIGFCLLAMRDGIVPPTLNLVNKDPACNLDFTPLCARRKGIARSLSLSYGFGGHIGVVGFKKT